MHLRSPFKFSYLTPSFVRHMSTAIHRPQIVVVGGSYVGIRAVEALAELKEADVTLIEKNTHFQHLFAFPRISIVPGFAQKAFVPYMTPFTSEYSPSLIQGVVEKVTPSSVVLSGGKEVPYNYLVLATGTSGSPTPLVGTEKKVEVQKFVALQDQVKDAKKIAVVGGGAYGVQVAFDVAEYYPEKSVVLIHSRMQLMNRFHNGLHDVVISKFKRIGVETILGQRVTKVTEGVEGKVVVLMDGTEVNADCVISCTGSRPLSSPLLSHAPTCVDSNGFVNVRPTMQIDDGKGEYPNIFCIGDVANTGAHKAARPAMAQVVTVATNIQKLMSNSSTTDLNIYTPPAASIHLYLGLKESVKFRNPEGAEMPWTLFEEVDNIQMGCERMWANRAPGVTDYDV